MKKMIEWGLPPIMIMTVILLRFTGDGVLNDSLDFCELFSGAGELSAALRNATCLVLSVHMFKGVGLRALAPFFQAGLSAISIDVEQDRNTQNLLRPAGFLLPGPILMALIQWETAQRT